MDKKEANTWCFIFESVSFSWTYFGLPQANIQPEFFLIFFSVWVLTFHDVAKGPFFGSLRYSRAFLSGGLLSDVEIHFWEKWAIFDRFYSV